MKKPEKIPTKIITLREKELEVENEDLRRRLRETERELAHLNRICECMSRELESLRDE